MERLHQIFKQPVYRIRIPPRSAARANVYLALSLSRHQPARTPPSADVYGFDRYFQYSCAYPFVRYIYMQLSCEVTFVNVHRIGICIGKSRYGRLLDFHGNGRHVTPLCVRLISLLIPTLPRSPQVQTVRSPSPPSFALVKLANARCHDW